LPLAHIFECVVEAYVTCSGAAIGFYQGEVTKLTEDCQALKPTMFMGVPRVFSKIYQKIFSAIDEKNCLVKFVVHRAFNAQANAVRFKQPVDEANDKKIFAPIRAKLGLDNVRLIVSGAAPCPPYVIEFLRIICKGADVLQGYGMTETAAGISIVSKGDITMGHCGPPVPCCEVKLRDVPEMNYLHTDANPRGEILVRGPNIFAGYYKNEKATSETIEAGGWLATGDIGRFNPNGTLSVIDRKKNIFKLSQGEYIAAERVETVYGKSAAVGQVWVYGNSFKSFVLAVVVPSSDWSKAKGTELGFWTGGAARPGEEKFIAAYKALYTATASAAAMKKALVDEMNKENSNLKGFEKVKDVIIESDVDKTLAGFTIENDCLTPSFKLKRPQLLKKYVKELKNAYKVNGEAPAEGEKWPGEDN
jgi:long-chain acyl-CoA synthetase